MMERCYNPKSSGYQAYGAKGVTVSSELQTLDGLIAAIGLRPVTDAIKHLCQEKIAAYLTQHDLLESFTIRGAETARLGDVAS